MSHPQGTSLLEACLVVAIIGLTMTFAIPSLERAQDSYQLNSAAHQIAGKLYRARILSISRQKDCRLRVTSPASYLVECQDGRWSAVEALVVAPGVTVSANRSPEFHPRGNVAPAATITVRNARGGQRKIIVNTAGRTRIE